MTEFTAAVSTAKDEASALRVAIERAAEALEAEVGAIVSLGLVKASLGFPQGEVPESDLVNVAEARQDQIEVPGAGDSHAIAVPLEGREPIGLVAFDCIARRGVLGEDGIKDEVDRIGDCAGGAPVAGFYTYGEIARTRGISGFHNQTLVVLAVG